MKLCDDCGQPTQGPGEELADHQLTSAAFALRLLPRHDPDVSQAVTHVIIAHAALRRYLAKKE